MKEEKKLEQQKVLNAEKTLSDEELGAVTGGAGGAGETATVNCRNCGASWTVQRSGQSEERVVCPQCGQEVLLGSRGSQFMMPHKL